MKVPNDITLKFGTGVVKPSNGFHLSRVYMVGPDFEKKAEEFEKLSKDFGKHTKVFEKHAEELEKHAQELEKKNEKIEKQTLLIAPEVEKYHDIVGGFHKNISPQIGQAMKIIMHAPSNGIIEGDITIDDFKGLVEASTIQGSITVNNMDGMVLANTVFISGKEISIMTWKN